MRPSKGLATLAVWITLAWAWQPPPVVHAASEPARLVLIVAVNHHLRDPGRRFHHADDGALLALDIIRRTAPSALVRVLASPDDPETQAAFDQAGVEPLAPTRADVDLAMRDFSRAAHEARTRRQAVELFFYFTGFADPGGILHLEDEPLPMDTLVNMLQQVQPDHAFALLDVVHPARTAPDGKTPLALPPLMPALSLIHI